MSTTQAVYWAEQRLSLPTSSDQKLLLLKMALNVGWEYKCFAERFAKPLGLTQEKLYKALIGLEKDRFIEKQDDGSWKLLVEHSL